jgi:hypothetical protein
MSKQLSCHLKMGIRRAKRANGFKKSQNPCPPRSRAPLLPDMLPRRRARLHFLAGFLCRTGASFEPLTVRPSSCR